MSPVPPQSLPRKRGAPLVPPVTVVVSSVISVGSVLRSSVPSRPSVIDTFIAAG